MSQTQARSGLTEAWRHVTEWRVVPGLDHRLGDDERLIPRPGSGDENDHTALVSSWTLQPRQTTSKMLDRSVRSRA